MPQFFIKSSLITDNRCTIDNDNYHHLIRVRRAKVNDKISLRLEDGSSVIARITEIGNSSLIAEIIGSKNTSTINYRLNLCLGLLKGKKFEMVIRKAVEIGVSSIIPVITERTIPELKSKEKKKIERWKKIAEEASKQSIRSDIADIGGITEFKDLISSDQSGIKILAHPGHESINLKKFISCNDWSDDISILIGPEGGFSNIEVQMARNRGWTDVNFGFSQMRAETAAIVLPSIFIYEYGNQS